jgi:hypothetical protein
VYPNDVLDLEVIMDSTHHQSSQSTSCQSPKVDEYVLNCS